MVSGTSWFCEKTAQMTFDIKIGGGSIRHEDLCAKRCGTRAGRMNAADALMAKQPFARGERAKMEELRPARADEQQIIDGASYRPEKKDALSLSIGKPVHMREENQEQYRQWRAGHLKPTAENNGYVT